MHQLRVLAVLMLAGCAAAPAPQAVFRDARVPIYSNATFDPSRLPGRWVQAAVFAAPGQARCRAGAAKIGSGLATVLRLCLDGADVGASGVLVPVGPGRLALQGTDGALAETWWVVWVDEGYRTLAVGTPSGRFGFILNRDGALPEDRFRAAAEIFDFNGYDTRALIRLR